MKSFISKAAGSLTLLTAITILAGKPSFGQKHFSQVLQTTPYSPKDSIRLNVLLNAAKSRSEVSAVLEKTLKSSRMRCYVYVVDKIKGWTVCYYDPNIKQFIDLGDKIVMQSKGSLANYIGYPEQFKALGDTVILFRPLQLQIGFDTEQFPLKYYFISNTRDWSCRLSADTLILYPVINVGSLQVIELRNSATSDSLLWKGSLRMLDRKQAGELRNLLSSLNQVFPNMTTGELEMMARSWLQDRFGPAEAGQLNDWIHQHFESK